MENETPTPSYATPENNSDIQAVQKQNKQPSNKLLAAVIIIFVALLAAVACLAAGIWNPVWNPFRPSPEKTFGEMINKMSSLKSYSSKTTFDLASDSSSGNVEIKGSATADTDSSDPNNKKTQGNFNIELSMEGMSFSLAADLEQIGQTSYIKFTEIPALLGMFGINTNSLENNWIKLDQQGLSDLSAGEIQQTPSASSSAAETEIANKIKQIFENKNLYSIKIVKSGKNDIPNTNHYAVILNNSEFAKTLPDLLDAFGSSTEFSSIYSLGQAKIMAKNDSIEGSFDSLRTEAELYYSYNSAGSGSYQGLDCNSNSIQNDCQTINQYAGQNPTIYTNKNSYCAFAPLAVDGYYYCVDSQGSAGITSNPSLQGYCNGQTFVCPAQENISAEALKKASQESFIKSADDFFNKIGELKVDFWIGKKDYYLYKAEFNKDIDLSVFSQNSTGTLSFDLSSELSNFNKPMDIQAPAESKTIEELMGSSSSPLGVLGQSRAQAADAAIQGAVESLRASAELWYGNHNYTYSGFCSGSDVVRAETTVSSTGGNLICNVSSNGQSYAIYSPLSSNSSQYWCADSTGNSLGLSFKPAAKATVCH